MLLNINRRNILVVIVGLLTIASVVTVCVWDKRECNRIEAEKNKLLKENK